jgi:hypothetical protein
MVSSACRSSEGRLAAGRVKLASIATHAESAATLALWKTVALRDDRWPRPAHDIRRSGRSPAPIRLWRSGVEAAGLVATVGNSVEGISVGDVVTTHSLPLREQGSWAEKFIAAAGHVAVVPPGVPVNAAAALPVPALTADQALTDGIDLQSGQTVLVNGAGGVTGGMLVQLAAHRGPGCWPRRAPVMPPAYQPWARTSSLTITSPAGRSG